MAWRGRVTAALTCATDSRVESQKHSFGFHPVAQAPVILFLSDHSTVLRSPQTMECNSSNCQVPRKIILRSSRWDVWFGESSPSFLG